VREDMSKHAAPEEVVEAPEPQPSTKGFKQEWIPHIAMVILFFTWLAFQFPVVNGGTTPTTINVAFAGTLGLWFPYLIREQTKGETK
jgi:hypothetical protein